MLGSIRVLGYALLTVGGVGAAVSGIVMFLYEIVYLHDWWGSLGVVAAVLVPPLVAAFPFLVVLNEGWGVAAPYFMWWAVGLASMIVIGLGLWLKDL